MNAKTEHTPGPWKVGANNGKAWLIEGQPAQMASGAIASVHNLRPDGVRSFETAANARLIAAAPELLEALKALLPVAQSKPMTVEQQADAIAVARVAVAKAKGV